MTDRDIQVNWDTGTASSLLSPQKEEEIAEVLLSLTQGSNPSNTNVVGSNPGLQFHTESAVPVSSQTGPGICPALTLVHPENELGDISDAITEDGLDRGPSPQLMTKQGIIKMAYTTRPLDLSTSRERLVPSIPTTLAPPSTKGVKEQSVRVLNILFKAHLLLTVKKILFQHLF